MHRLTVTDKWFLEGIEQAGGDSYRLFGAFDIQGQTDELVAANMGKGLFPPQTAGESIADGLQQFLTR
jgi:hypothetical protein